MYNIAKVAKGEILLYFNEVFDALCKVFTSYDTTDFSLLPIKKYPLKMEQNSSID